VVLNLEIQWRSLGNVDAFRPTRAVGGLAQQLGPLVFFWHASLSKETFFKWFYPGAEVEDFGRFSDFESRPISGCGQALSIP
jgi:hypothetical protein